MPGIEAVLGACVDTVSFGAAHFQLRLSTDDAEFSITTSADVSREDGGGRSADFRESGVGSGIIGLIGAELCTFVVNEPARSATLLFDDERQVTAWWPDKVYDNLFIVSRDGSDEWWVVERPLSTNSRHPADRAAANVRSRPIADIVHLCNSRQKR